MPAKPKKIDAVAKNLGALLAKIRQLESNVGRVVIAKVSPIPAGHTAAIARLHEMAETERRDNGQRSTGPARPTPTTGRTYRSASPPVVEIVFAAAIAR